MGVQRYQVLKCLHRGALVLRPPITVWNGQQLRAALVAGGCARMPVTCMPALRP